MTIGANVGTVDVEYDDITMAMLLLRVVNPFASPLKIVAEHLPTGRTLTLASVGTGTQVIVAPVNAQAVLTFRDRGGKLDDVSFSVQYPAP